MTRFRLPSLEVMRILRGMLSDGALDGKVVAVVGEEYDELDSIRPVLELSAAWEYEELTEAQLTPTG